MLTVIVILAIAWAVLLPSFRLYKALVRKSLNLESKFWAALWIWLLSMALLLIAWVFVNMLALGPIFCPDFDDLRGYCRSDGVNGFVWKAYLFLSPIASGLAIWYFATSEDFK